MKKGDGVVLPKGWEIKKLGEICEVITKGTTPTSIGFKFTPTGINFIKVESIDLNGHFIPNKFANISKEAHEALKRSQLKNGDILFSIAGALGRSTIVNDTILPANTNQALSIIRLKKNMDILKSYVFLTLKSGYVLAQIEKSKGGVAQQNLSLTQIRRFEIPIPPLSEQKKIVSILDRAFEAIDKAKANAEQNLKNAKEIFQSKLQTIFDNGQLKIDSGEWEEKKIKELGIVQTGNTPPTKEKTNYGNFIPFAKPPHFKQNGKIDTGESMLSKKGLKKGRLFGANSILMVCIGATIGKTAFSEKPISTNQQINGLTPPKNHYPRFYYYAFISDTVQKQVLKQGKSAQATLPIINKTKWENILVPFPKSIETQKQIVSQLDKLQTETKKLEATYQKKIEDLEELKKSILQKAFSGQLTMDNGELKIENE